MKSVLPTDLHPNRVFFTEFDRVTYSQVAWSAEEVHEIQENLERKLKLLTLTKGNIVIAASHLLESELARKLVFDHPELLTQGVIVPSLRSEYATCVQFLESKRTHPDKGESEHFKNAEATEMAALIDAAPAVVRWGLHDMSDWFKQRLLTDLADDKSLFRLAVRRAGIVLPADLAGKIEKEESLSRGAVYRVAEETKIKPLWDMLCNYADFIYYLSGARTTNSEGVLPQENLLDFSIGDLAGQRTRLSEHEVFFKLFIDVVKAKTSTYFPTDVLDALSVSDTLELHGIAVSSDFTAKYHDIQAKTKEALIIADPERLVLMMQELEAYERDLYTKFNETLDRELTSRQRGNKKTESRKLLHSIASLLIPYYDTPGTTVDVVINGLRFAGKRDIAQSIEKRIDEGLHACESVLEKLHIADRQILLDFVDAIKRRYTMKLFSN